MNQLLDQMATMPFTIACLFAVVMMIIALRGDTRNARQKIMITWLEKENEQRLEAISEVNMELAEAREELEALDNKLKFEQQMSRRQGNRIDYLTRAFTSVYPIARVLLKDETRFLSWLSGRENPKGKKKRPVPPSITREARQAAGTMREINCKKTAK